MIKSEGYRLRGILLSSLFSKLIEVGLPLGSVGFPIVGSYISSCVAGLTSNQKIVGYPVTFVPLLLPGVYLSVLVIILAYRAHSFSSCVWGGGGGT